MNTTFEPEYRAQRVGRQVNGFPTRWYVQIRRESNNTLCKEYICSKKPTPSHLEHYLNLFMVEKVGAVV